jgi:carbon monoxide dehydrogenase subunit G
MTLDGVSAQLSIERTVERVWEFLTDYDRLPCHLSGLTSSRLLRAENGYKVVRQVGRPGLPLLPAELAVTLRVEEDCPRRISFEQIEGFFKSFRGSWELYPRGETTLLRYHLSARPPGFLPAALLRPVLRRGVESALAEVKAALERSPERAGGAVAAGRP